MNDIHTLSSDLLVTNLKTLVAREREVASEVVRYLCEVGRRRLYLERGYSSLYAFCTEGLGYSEGAAMRRIASARCADETPEVLEKLEDGSLSLSTVAELAKVPEIEKRKKLIELSSGQSKAVVEELVVREVPTVKAAVRETVKFSVAPPSSLSADTPQEKRVTVTLELTEDEYRLLQQVQVITSERRGSRAVVRALRLYKKLRSPEERMKRRAQRRAQAAEKAEATAAAAAEPTPTAKVITRHISAPTQDEVKVEGKCQCSFVGIDGRRCTETCGLQMDHVYPYSMGGSHDKENLRLLCAAHNRFVYEQVAGGRLEGNRRRTRTRDGAAVPPLRRR